MKEPTPDVLQHRAEILTQSLGLVLGNHVPAEKFSRLYANRRRLVNDWAQVYLGLKPAATFLDPLSESLRHQHILYTSILPRQIDEETPIMYSADGFAIWNPHQIQTIIEENKTRFPFLQHVEHDASKSLFYGFLKSLYGKYASYAYHRIGGLLTGIPAEATEQFVHFSQSVETITRHLVSDANFRKIPHQLKVVELINDLQAEPELKAEVLRLSEVMPDHNGHLDYRDFLEYLRGLRFAKVPGFAYYTSGNLTVEHEERITRLHQQSGINQRLEALLA